MSGNGVRAQPIHCPWCDSRHMPRFLCEAAASILAEMHQRAREKADANTMPTLDFDEPVERGPDWEPVLMTQLVVEAVHVPVGAHRTPGIIFTGRDQHGKPLPRWLYVGQERELRALQELVNGRVERALSAARAANGG